MHTEEDLRAAVSAIADRAPSPDDVRIVIPPAGGERIRPPRRPRVLVAVVAATAAAAVTIPAASTLLDNETPAGSPNAGGLVLHSTFRLQTPAGWQQEGRTIGLDDQRIPLSGPDDLRCIVRVLEPGAFDASRIPSGSDPLTVSGRPGYFARIKNPFDLEPPAQMVSPSPGVVVSSNGGTNPWERFEWTVVWQYADDAWAMSSCYDGTNTKLREQDLRMANAAVVEPAPVQVPVTFAHLPDGQQPRTAGVRDPHLSGNFMYDFDLSVGDSRSAGQFIGYIAGESVGAPPEGSTRLTVNGLPAWIDPGSHQLVITGTGFEAIVMSTAFDDTRPEAERRAELLATAQGMRFAPDSMDTSTWFDGSEALPR